MYPSFKDITTYNGSTEFSETPTAPTEVTSPTPPPPQAAKALHSSNTSLLGKVCAICRMPLLSKSEELKNSCVLFASCAHVVHLACVARHLQNIGSKYDEETWQSSCAECLLSGKGNFDDDISEGDRDEFLRSFKVRFATAHQGQNYDQFKKTQASHELKRYILCGKPLQKSFASAAAESMALKALTTKLTMIASRLRMKRIETIDDTTTLVEKENKENQGDEIDEMIRTTPFVDLMFMRNRTLDSVLALEDGNLLQLYRCGVQSYDDLRALGFNPVLHLQGQKTPKIPAWQMHDLYGFTFEHLVGSEEDGGFSMPIRDVVEFVKMRTAEWSIIGATASKFIALRITKEAAAKLDMTLSQWERYLGLQPAHLTAIGITSKHDFVNVMQWDSKSHLCPTD